MAKTRKPKDDKIVERIQQQYKDLFSERDALPAPMSIPQMEALKARVAELESKLKQQESSASELSPTTAPEEPHEQKPVAKPAMPKELIQANSESPASAEIIVKRQKNISLITAGIFAFLGLAFLIFEIYAVVILQRGRLDFSDPILLPTGVLMVLIAVASFFLIQRDRHSLGTGLLFYSFVMAPPIIVILLVQGMATTVFLYIVTFGSIMIAWVMPRSSRRVAILSTITSVILCLVIELWNPSFRVVVSFENTDFVMMVITIAAILAFFIFQFSNLSLRPKVITALVGITVLTVGVIAYYLLNQIYQNAYNTAATQITDTNQQHILSIQTFLSEHSQDVMILSQLPDLNRLITDKASGAGPSVITSDTAAFTQDLQAFFIAHPVYDNVRFIDANGQEVAKVTASYISTTLQNKATRPFFAIPAKMPAGSLYLSPLELEQDLGKIIVPNVPVVRFATPVYYNDKLAGVVVANIVAKNFLNVLNDPNQHVLLVDQKGFYLYDNQITKKLFGGTTDLNTGFTIAKDMPTETASLFSGNTGSFTDQQNIYFYAPITILNGTTPSWFLLYEVPQSQIYAAANRTLTTSVLILVAILLVAIAIAVYLGNTFTAPLIALTHSAQEAAQGNLSVQSNVRSNDEIGVLANTFNLMTSQLSNMIGTLEQHVAERTHDLELASEVGRTVTEKVANLNQMLTSAVEMIRARFNLYYTQVYLMDASGRTFSLRAGTGEVGKQLLESKHRLTVGSGSLNGRAVAQKKPIIVVDTTQSENFLPNPLLPKTRSEMVIPLIAGEKLLGVLDMQSENIGALNEDNLPVFETLTSQLAIAIQNATLFAAAEEARSEVEAQIHRQTDQGWQEFLDAIERGQKVGFAFNQESAVPLQPTTLSESTIANALKVPINVAGEKIGIIQLGDVPNREWTDREAEITQATARQLAQHIENLRLLAQAQRYRAQAEDAVRRLTHEGWDNYLEEHSQETAGFAFDLNEIRPLNEDKIGGQNSGIVQALTVQDEIVGELSAHPGESSQEEAKELLSAVATQLSAHLENLRLTISNMSLLQSTEARAQREQTLRQITTALRSSTNPATIMRTAARELGNILGRKTLVQLATPEQANQTEPTHTGNEPDESASQSR